MRWIAPRRALTRDRAGLEVSTLVLLVLGAVFLLAMIAAYIIIFREGSFFAGEDSICSRTFGFLRGCS